jgi:hypothetical protein
MGNNPTHTPGPWKMDRDGAILASDYEKFPGKKDGIARIVCDVRDSEKWGMEHERAVANGYLIAAAPDLLAALKLMMRDDSRSFAMARAAIAKAEGK